ncbi:MAG: hypothetical protein POELPBGB_01395 [Bacteroidia bacterium]|nr:hypothetical protein [Bacteroidia bacterium]
MHNGYSLEEFYTAQFYTWEQRGRGWNVFQDPVELEPEFIPFFGHLPPQYQTTIDDGVRPRFFPTVVDAFSTLFGTKEKEQPQTEEAVQYLQELYPINAYNVIDERPRIRELHFSFQKDTRIELGFIEQLLVLLSNTRNTLSFEIVGHHDKIQIQLSCDAQDVSIVRSYVEEYLPTVVVSEFENMLLQNVEDHMGFAIHELGLAQEFMRPIKCYDKFSPDPLAGCLSVLGTVQKNERAIVQVLFKGTVNQWAQSMMRAATDHHGKSFFRNDPDMAKLVQEKVSKPLFVATIRVLTISHTVDKAMSLNNEIVQSLSALHRQGCNSFTSVPIQSIDCVLEDVENRLSRRTGMILNAGELASIVHIPDMTVSAPKLRTYQGKTKPAPEAVLHHDFVLGLNNYLGQERKAALSVQQRLRHTHVIGATGTGKSNFLLQSIIQDMQLGNGLCVLDPHGDLIEKAIEHIPAHRIKDVVLLDPSDTDYPVGLNLLFAKTEPEKIILSSDIVSLFKRFATSWGDQMTSVLANAVIAFLEHEDGGTFLDLRQFLTDDAFRAKTLQKVNDPNIVYYWKKEFPLLRSNSIAPILTRLDTFLRPRIVRNMMVQKSGIDFHDVINSKKIFLVKLSQGLIGEDNSYLLGSIIVAKLHQAALHRQNMKEEARLPFFLYIDEFQHFITPSMSSILSGARKYGLGLVLAHQDLEQLRTLDKELANSVLSNPATRVCFRCGEEDAKQLANSFSSFDETDIQNLNTGQAIVRVERKDNDFNIAIPFIEAKNEKYAQLVRNKVAILSRSAYGKPREEVEELLAQSLRFSERKAETEKTEIPKQEAKQEPQPEQPKEQPQPEFKEADEAIQQKGKEFTEKEEQKREMREHRYLQELIKRIAEGYGFKAVIEEPTPDGKGRVDVGLIKDNLKIACEIAVTNTKEYEVGNIKKCFHAGYSKVFVCSENTVHLGRIQTLCETHFSKTELKNIVCCQTAELFTFLSTIQKQPEEKIVKGYRIKVNVGTASSDSQQQVANTILNSLRRNKK